ncbi:MAG: DNA-deoxyinosine glycosylase [Ruminococcaceae bacterium]|nr:DNA-deoxyinosine glycosylase [Oscillospiraceae bacterium]
MPVHPIAPVFDKDSKVLILGSFPSVRSREEGFFYGHPQNRFWKVTSQIFGEELPVTIDEKKAFLIRNHIALWDVIGSCEIDGSSDSSIRDVTVNDLSVILDVADIRAIFLNGKKAEQYYLKYLFPVLKRDAVCLPSTSPANAAWNLDKLADAWKIIKDNADAVIIDT